jgi:tetratricopeptide (TPR) repeat protein
MSQPIEDGPAIDGDRFEIEFSRAQALILEGETEAAIEAFDACIALVEEILRSNTGNQRLERWLAISYASRAEVLLDTGQGLAALDCYEKAVSLFDQISLRAGHAIAAVSDVVRARGKVLDILMELDDPDRARPLALELEQLLEGFPADGVAADPPVLEVRAQSHSELGRCFGKWGPQCKASRHQSRAAALLEQALSLKPGDYFLELNLAITCFLYGQQQGPSKGRPWLEKSYSTLKSMQLRMELPPQGEQALEAVREALGWELLHGREGPPNRHVWLG